MVDFTNGYVAQELQRKKWLAFLLPGDEKIFFCDPENRYFTRVDATLFAEVIQISAGNNLPLQETLWTQVSKRETGN